MKLTYKEMTEKLNELADTFEAKTHTKLNRNALMSGLNIMTTYNKFSNKSLSDKEITDGLNGAYKVMYTKSLASIMKSASAPEGKKKMEFASLIAVIGKEGITKDTAKLLYTCDDETIDALARSFKKTSDKAKELGVTEENKERYLELSEKVKDFKLYNKLNMETISNELDTFMKETFKLVTENELIEFAKEPKSRTSKELEAVKDQLLHEKMSDSMKKTLDSLNSEDLKKITTSFENMANQILAVKNSPNGKNVDEKPYVKLCNDLKEYAKKRTETAKSFTVTKPVFKASVPVYGGLKEKDLADTVKEVDAYFEEEKKNFENATSSSLIHEKNVLLNMAKNSSDFFKEAKNISKAGVIFNALEAKYNSHNPLTKIFHFGERNAMADMKTKLSAALGKSVEETVKLLHKNTITTSFNAAKSLAADVKDSMEYDMRLGYKPVMDSEIFKATMEPENEMNHDFEEVDELNNAFILEDEENADMKVEWDPIDL